MLKEQVTRKMRRVLVITIPTITLIRQQLFSRVMAWGEKQHRQLAEAVLPDAQVARKGPSWSEAARLCPKWRDDASWRTFVQSSKGGGSFKWERRYSSETGQLDMQVLHA